MPSTYKLNKKCDSIQPWCTPFPILNQSNVPCLILTVAFCPAYRFLRRLVRWSGVPVSSKIFHSLLWSTQGFPGGSVEKNPPVNAGATGDTSLIPVSGIAHGEGNGNWLQYSCQGNPRNRGAWWVTIHGVTKSWPWLSTHTHTDKGFSVVHDVDVFLEFPCFFYDPMDAGNLISGFSAFSNPALHL